MIRIISSPLVRTSFFTGWNGSWLAKAALILKKKKKKKHQSLTGWKLSSADVAGEGMKCRTLGKSEPTLTPCCHFVGSQALSIPGRVLYMLVPLLHSQDTSDNIIYSTMAFPESTYSKLPHTKHLPFQLLCCISSLLLARRSAHLTSPLLERRRGQGSQGTRLLLPLTHLGKPFNFFMPLLNHL